MYFLSLTPEVLIVTNINFLLSLNFRHYLESLTPLRRKRLEVRSEIQAKIIKTKRYEN